MSIISQNKNGTTILIAVPPQHKHKIKHDKTTMQSTCQCRGDISNCFPIFTYKKQHQEDSHLLNKW
ncbi:hypothetical protein D0T87_13040 [Bacteroides sp. 51]|nr:hypothetical protein [Bacteroides sp. 51]